MTLSYLKAISRATAKNIGTSMRKAERVRNVLSDPEGKGSGLQALTKRKSRLAEPSLSAKRRTKLEVVNN